MDIEEARRRLAAHPRKGDPTAEPGETLAEKAARLREEQAAEHADCPFCQIIAWRAPATVVRSWPDALAIVPLGPVVNGHTLVIPKTHVTDFAENPRITGITMFRAAELAWDMDQPMNLITSKGHEATQTVMHLHAHLVPRAANDGLALPWYSGKGRKGSH